MTLDTLSDEIANLSPETRVGIVAEGYFTWGEQAARELADALAVPFEDCAEAIERLRYRVQ